MAGSRFRNCSQQPPTRVRVLVLAMVVNLTSLTVTPSSVSPAHAGAVRRNRPAEQPFDLCCVRPQDQIWLISTRNLGHCADPCQLDAPELRYCRFDLGTGWSTSSAEEFFATDQPGLLTTVYVHGNRMTADAVVERGLKMYGGLICDECDPSAIRHVIWSWPSQPLPRRWALVRDARVKATRTPLQSYYLGWWLAQLQPDMNVSLIGFSYGSRTILGALHLLGEGQLCGRCLPPGPYETKVQPRVALWATACDVNWISPGNCNGCALSQMNRGLIFYNCCDPVLRRYKRLLPEATGPALGLNGIPCPDRLELHGHKIQQFDATDIIGKRHQWVRYFESPCIMCQVRKYALWHDVD